MSEKEKAGGCNIECKHEECELVVGNTIKVDIGDEDCEVRADIAVERRKTVRIWGQVVDLYGEPVAEALVKLIKVKCSEGKTKLISLAHTVTDCKGFYQFEICGKKKKNSYLIVAGKAAAGNERIVYEMVECVACDLDNSDC
jgi:hypothetical protein